MKNIQKKRGFTIVELVIVIAVIAILAAVLIPTFSNVIARAKISADTQLCRNLNTVLTMATSEGRVPGSMYDVLYLVSESGYLLGNLNPTAEGYYYAWDSQGEKIVYIREDLDTVVYPEDYTIDKSKCWITVGDKEEAERVA
ncbi:MAG: type II secretion system protein, partial [Clostridia bacterium]|nr:type II secretion system protein [Clostridia bacterium]